jgi:hypothetical protein
VEREPLRGALPDAGQAGELGDEVVDRGCEHEQSLRSRPSRLLRAQ